jgi:hypothetical protein
MFFVYSLSWWYGAGWKLQFSKMLDRLANIGRAFSGGTLIRTLFNPWKQIISGAERQASLESKMRAVLDNIISRFVGFGIRSFTLIAALISISAVLIISVVWLIIWPIIPITPVIGFALFVWRY